MCSKGPAGISILRSLHHIQAIPVQLPNYGCLRFLAPCSHSIAKEIGEGQRTGLTVGDLALRLAHGTGHWRRVSGPTPGLLVVDLCMDSKFRFQQATHA